MKSYILRAKNPSKLSSAEFIYYVGSGGWSTSDYNVVYYFEKQYAEEALKEANNPALEIEIVESVDDGPKADAKDGDGDGLVEDGTEFERPVEAKKVVRKRSTTTRRKKAEG